MKKRKGIFAGLLSLALMMCSIGQVQASDDTIAMHRMYNPTSGEHFYTGSFSERDNLAFSGWQYEGVSFEAPTTSETPVYRLYNPNSGDHHYTVSAEERDHLVQVGWNDEGIGWYSDDNKTVPLYRLYNPNADVGSHHYTVSEGEKESLKSLGWNDEAIGWYGKSEGNFTTSGFTGTGVKIRYIGGIQDEEKTMCAVLVYNETTKPLNIKVKVDAVDATGNILATEYMKVDSLSPNHQMMQNVIFYRTDIKRFHCTLNEDDIEDISGYFMYEDTQKYFTVSAKKSYTDIICDITNKDTKAHFIDLRAATSYQGEFLGCKMGYLQIGAGETKTITLASTGIDFTDKVGFDNYELYYTTYSL